MTIGELSQKSGLSRDTIRYYERLGLFTDAERAGNNYRVYDERALVILGLIRRCKSLGFTLREIESFLEGMLKGRLTFGDVQSIIQAKIDDIEGTISQLRAHLDQLRGILERCPHDQPISEALSQPRRC